MARPEDALESALLLSHRIGREDIRECAVSQVAMGWALLGEPDKAVPLADRVPPGSDPFGLSPWGALQKACAAQTHAAVGAIETGLKEFEDSLVRLAEMGAVERRQVILPLAAAIVAAHEATGDPRFAAFPERLRETFTGDTEREVASRAALRVDLAVFRAEHARRGAESAIVAVQDAKDKPSAEVQAYAVETIAEYTEATGDRGLLPEGLGILHKIEVPHQRIRARAALGRALRDVGDLLQGERLIREAQGDLPSLQPRDRVLGAMHIARVSARDGHLAGADALLQWARWQLTQVTPADAQLSARGQLASGFAHVGAHLGDPARLEAALVLIRAIPASLERDQVVLSLGRYLVAYATVATRLQRRLDRLETRVGSSPPWGFKGLVAESREALSVGAVPSARQAIARAGRMVFAHIQEVPDMDELWVMMKELHRAFVRWDPAWGAKTEFLGYLEDAQHALKVRDWRTLRDRLRRAQLLLLQRGGGSVPRSELPKVADDS